MACLDIAFWVCTGLVAYAYFGYPMILWAVSIVKTRGILKADITPSVTFIITAYNEESQIVEKLENTLKLRYPSSLLEIIVASDCSTDKTDDVAKSYACRGVKLVRAPHRKGKEAAQKLAILSSSGDVLVFSDVATILPESAIANIVKNFADPTVGCVSSEDRFIDSDGKISGEGAYVRYEMVLRSLESRFNSLVGLSGSFFAARSSVCKALWSEHLQSDFNTVLNSMRIGLRGVADSESIGYYKNIKDEKKEFDRKVRTVLRGISVFMKSWGLVNPFRYPTFAWQLISHKLCRWLVPFALALMLMSNLLLLNKHWGYMVTFVFQILFYGVGMMGWIYPNRLHGITRIPTFFLVVNWAILHAWYRYLRGDRIVGWQPSDRSRISTVDSRLAK